MKQTYRFAQTYKYQRPPYYEHPSMFELIGLIACCVSEFSDLNDLRGYNWHRS